VSFILSLPEPSERRIVETPLMRKSANRTIAVHGGGGLVVWTGPSRNGKTETARWLVQKIAEASETALHGFRAVHYEVGEIPATWGGSDQKRGIRSLWHATIGKMPETIYRQYPTEALAAELVHGWQASNTQMALVDEAGLLCLGAIRGMTLAVDIAALQEWPFTLVFIGMDDLPSKIKSNEQVKNRVHEWVFFEPYSIEDTLTLLAALHPHFATLDLGVPSHHAQVAFIHEQYGGLPGHIVPFLQRLKPMEAEILRPLNRQIDLGFLRAVHLRTREDERRAMEEENARGGKDAPHPRSAKPKPHAKPARQQDAWQNPKLGGTHKDAATNLSAPTPVSGPTPSPATPPGSEAATPRRPRSAERPGETSAPEPPPGDPPIQGEGDARDDPREAAA
jgi:hypothetical protein